MRVTIVIPTYNEEESISIIINQLQKIFATISQFEINILVFDSHSRDKTVEIVKSLQQKWSDIFLVEEKHKSGLGSAYIQAMQYAVDELKADVVFEFDADGSHQPKHIPEMLLLIKQGHDVVVGSRYVHGGVIATDWPWYRRFLSKGGNWLARLLLTRRYKDFTSGFRATRTEWLRKIDLAHLLSKQYAYKIHLLWALHKAGADIVESPIEFVDRSHGYSKFPRNNIRDSLIVIIKLRLFELKRYFKVCICGVIGAVIQFTIFNVLRQSIHPAMATVFAVEAAIISNFFSNNLISFKDHGLLKSTSKKLWLKKLLQFNFVSLISLAIQVLIMFFGIMFFGKTALAANLLLIAGIILASLINYFFYKSIIWKVTNFPKEDD